MKLYKFKVVDSVGWDQYDGFVVRAESEAAARALIIASYSYNSEVQEFSNPEYMPAFELTQDGPPSIVLHSFNAG